MDKRAKYLLFQRYKTGPAHHAFIACLPGE